MDVPNLESFHKTGRKKERKKKKDKRTDEMGENVQDKETKQNTTHLHRIKVVDIIKTSNGDGTNTFLCFIF